jgi:hypothetical protein
MKPENHMSTGTRGCTVTSCIKCRLCRAVNYEERRTGRPDQATGAKSLYAAEAMAYYFYFFPKLKVG